MKKYYAVKGTTNLIFGSRAKRDEYIAANPDSEIDERLDDTVRLCITLLLYSGATLLVAWWAAHRALSPVRELEAGLQRLARGENGTEKPLSVSASLVSRIAQDGPASLAALGRFLDPARLDRFGSAFLAEIAAPAD